MCPICGEKAFITAGGLMRHLTTMHAGDALSSDAVDVLRLLDRTVCSEAQCGGINRVGVRQCNRCGRASNFRPLQVGDVIPGPRAVPLPTASQPNEAANSPPDRAPASQASAAIMVDVELPADWLSRVRSLPSNTRVHTPLAFRAKLAQAWALCLEGIEAELPGYCKLEEARSKLLLGECPQGAYAPKELAERFALWEASEYGQLLARAEAQTLLRSSERQRNTAKRQNAERQTRRRRAKKFVAEGAYRKAVGTLTTDVSTLTPQQQQSFAERLLPSSARADALHGPVAMEGDGGSRAALSQARNTFSSEEDHPLKGVRYGALTAPGPTGTRPEHAKEAFGIRQKAVARRLARAMLKVQQRVQAGNLPEDARWLTRTRLVYLKKKGSQVPRPIRVGEFMRSSVSKKVQKLAAPRLRKVFHSMHQWGVAMPGGAEALVHWRECVESLAIAGRIPPVVAFDLDLANMFCNVEWPEIRSAVGKHFAEACGWLEWCHATPEAVVLPCGSVHMVNRGAGQGDVYGSTSCALGLGERLFEHRTRFGANAVDEWFIDDGQGLVGVHHADAWLRSVDKAIADLGGHRATGAECKTHARLLCTPQVAADNPEWASPYIKATCIVTGCAEAPKVLGVRLGAATVSDEDMEKVCVKVATTRDKIEELNSPAAELTLQRVCLNVSKASYLLRCSGDRIADDKLCLFDKGMAAGLESALWEPLSDDAWVQATMAVDAGGLGMREARNVALPAFLASRVAARPLVAEMATHTEEAGVCPASLCMQAYDERSQAALNRWLGELPLDVHARVHAIIQDGLDLAGQRWRSWCLGVEPPAPGTDDHAQSLAGRAGEVVGSVGSQDPEHPGSVPASSPLHLQRLLTRVADQCAAQGLMGKFAAEERWDDVHRLSDLAEPAANHEWLWALHANKAKRLEADEYVGAVRLRLGCAGPAEPALCGNCGVHIIGCNGAHALLCARGESTRGHNAVRDELFAMAHAVDATTEKEPEGLIPSHPLLRPADVLTGAFHNGRLAAVDVGVICPAAAGAGADCVVSMDQRKRDRMEPFKDELDRGGVEYHPFAVSCWGRLHPAASRMLENIAKRTARREGGTTQRAVLHRLRARITTEIMRRAARMVIHCRPQPPEAVDEGAVVSMDVTVDADLRAGDPGTALVPPYLATLAICTGRTTAPFPL